MTALEIVLKVTDVHFSNDSQALHQAFDCVERFHVGTVEFDEPSSGPQPVNFDQAVIGYFRNKIEAIIAYVGLHIDNSEQFCGFLFHTHRWHRIIRTYAEPNRQSIMAPINQGAGKCTGEQVSSSPFSSPFQVAARTKSTMECRGIAPNPTKEAFRKCAATSTGLTAKFTARSVEKKSASHTLASGWLGGDHG